MIWRIHLFLVGCCCWFASASSTLAFIGRLPSRRQATAFVPTSRTLLFAEQQNDDKEKKNKVLEFLMDPYESKIPEEMKEEIYRAEGNTPAAKERTQRVITYGFIAIALVGCAFFNGFLTELRHSDIMDASEGNMSLQDLGFGWVEANFLFRFLFLNKIGGGLALVSGAATGMLAEAELDSRRQNAERIWEELERRRNESAPKRKKRKKPVVSQTRSKKKQSGKQAKRLGALSEVVLEEPKPESVTEKESVVAVEEKKEGVMDKLKGWYDKADSMAASQALLLNKKLEEEGIVEKITDETGLKIIGKEAAAKLQAESETKTEAEASEKVSSRQSKS